MVPNLRKIAVAKLTLAYLFAASRVASATERFRFNVGTGRTLAQAHARGNVDRAVSTGNIVKTIVGLAVGGLVAAFILPIALDELAAADTTNFSSGAESLWNILDVIIVLAAFLMFIFIALRHAGRV